MRQVIIGSLFATTMVLTGCGESEGATNLVVRGSENPFGAHPGQVRAIAGVAIDGCQAWLLDFPSFGGAAGKCTFGYRRRKAVRYGSD